MKAQAPPGTWCSRLSRPLPALTTMSSSAMIAARTVVASVASTSCSPTLARIATSAANSADRSPSTTQLPSIVTALSSPFHQQRPPALAARLSYQLVDSRRRGRSGLPVAFCGAGQGQARRRPGGSGKYLAQRKEQALEGVRHGVREAHLEWSTGVLATQPEAEAAPDQRVLDLHGVQHVER